MTCVLIVEDKQEHAYYLKALFESHGWTTQWARHGAEALVNARMTPPNIVISDLLMPVMDGYTLLRHWKSDARLRAVPFVVYTATYTDVEDEQLALSLGADAFILKPSEPDVLFARTEEVRQRTGTRGVGPAEQPTGNEADLLKLYSQTLIRKLEEKTLELEETNRALLLEQAELRMRDSAIQAIRHGILITDPNLPDNPIVYASPGFYELTGYTSEETLGRNCRFLQARETDPEAIAVLRRAVQGAQPCAVELLNQRKDGSLFWNDLTLSPVKDASGKLTHFVGVQTDATERRRLADQLRQAKKMEAVGQLAAGVAHDFNNILSVILSYSSFALEQLRPEEPMREDMEEIYRAGQRAAELTKQLLAFSRQQVLQPRVVDLRHLVIGMEKMLRRLISEAVGLSLLTGQEPSRVNADATQIEQIIMNLAVNARDAMPRGGSLTIEVANLVLDEEYAATHHGVKPGAYVMLAVTDTGVGIDPATREHIFEPFFSTKERGKGTGLGLSTVFGIIKQSEGHVWVYSEPNQGTTFRVYLPRVDRELDPPLAPPPPPATLRGTETILLVEDEDQLRTMARAMLRRQGYNVLEAQNAGEALLICEQYTAKIHLLLTDVVMPRMSGKQLAERLGPVRPEMKVLFMSGYTENAIVHHGVLDAGIAFVEKPLTPEPLLRKVRELLDA